MNVFCELAAFVSVTEEVGQNGDNGTDDLKGNMPSRASYLVSNSWFSINCHQLSDIINKHTPRTIPSGKMIPKARPMRIICIHNVESYHAHSTGQSISRITIIQEITRHVQWGHRRWRSLPGHFHGRHGRGRPGQRGGREPATLLLVK